MRSNHELCYRDVAKIVCAFVLFGLFWSTAAESTEPLVSQPPTPEVCGPITRPFHPLPPEACPWCDSLNTYSIGSTGPFQVVDRTAEERLWHCYDAASDPCDPPVPNGTRAIWCGTSDPARVEKPGYPDNTYQILYIDTGTHGGNYTLTLDHNIGAEAGYDFLYLIGGGSGAVDPICNSRAILDACIAYGTAGSGEELLVSWTGNIRVGGAINATLGSPVELEGSSVDPPLTVSSSISISSAHRALYFVFRSDSRFSQEDGLWCHGWGVVLDRIQASDKGAPFYDDAICNGFVTDACGGAVLVGTAGNPIISARIPTPWGVFAHLERGSNIPTPDPCSPQQSLTTNLMFDMSDPASHHLPPSFQSIVGCSFPLPAGLASVQVRWMEYMDLPEADGFVRYGEFRIFHGGVWSRWKNAALSGGVHQGGLMLWRTEEEELADCDGMSADSVQIRLTVQCVPPLAVDHTNCGFPYLGLVFDDICLDLTTGVGNVIFGIFPGSVAQSTFVDGTIPGTNCTAAQVTSGVCWPGVRGSAILGGAAIDDNFNSPSGDSITLAIAVSGLSGRRINWHYAFDKCISGGRMIAHLNPVFNPLFGAPRVIYRIFDPTTKLWSPFDSSELDVDAFDAACAPGGTDTSLAGCTFRMDWPPRDKYYVNTGGADIGPNADLAFPGGWTLNGRTNYSQVKFLPRGTRIQYYFKGVSADGAVAYQFRTDLPGLEVEDLPNLPSTAIRAPDIIEFDVLPRAYSPGAAGTLLAGRTDTPILNLDGAYTAWSYGEDPITKALRGMGVRADRYRLLQGLQQGNNIGGHERPGQRIARLGNYFPNLDEYGILDLLRSSYRILIVPTHARQGRALDEQDALLIRDWWNSDTGSNAGDRCVLATGDDLFNGLLNVSVGFPGSFEEPSLAQNVFGVITTTSAWSGTYTTPYPYINDTFAGGAAGLGYKLDGGCPIPNRFDGLAPSPGSLVIAPYPGGSPDRAGISRTAEQDALADNDRSKSLAYGFSLQYVRDPNATPDVLGKCCCCAYGGLRQRMVILYRFLTSCRGPRTVSSQCWPCPADTTTAALTGNWAAMGTQFDTATFGPLYAIQDYSMATAVEEPLTAVPAFSNMLFQNRPNPFNPETVIPYTLSASGRVIVRIYDVAGRQVRILVNGVQTEGVHVARWNGVDDAGRQMASGVYFYRITYPEGAESARKMIMVR